MDGHYNYYSMLQKAKESTFRCTLYSFYNNSKAHNHDLFDRQVVPVARNAMGQAAQNATRK